MLPCAGAAGEAEGRNDSGFSETRYSALSRSGPRGQPRSYAVCMTSENTAVSASGVTMFGAAWCGDCRRTKAQLDGLGIDYTYVDLEADESAAEVAREISGRTNIPVVVYPDATHHVEPSNADVEAKLRELSLI